MDIPPEALARAVEEAMARRERRSPTARNVNALIWLIVLGGVILLFGPFIRAGFETIMQSITGKPWG